MTKRSPQEARAPRDRLHINFNRKIMSQATLTTLVNAIATHGSVRGDAVTNVIEDLRKLRHLCENIVETYESGDRENALRGLEALRLIL
jgi:hypothetical protein